MASPDNPAKNLAKVFANGSRKDVERILRKTNHNINEVLNCGSPSPFWPVSWTALIYACRNLNIEVVRVLLDKGADPNISSTGGISPIMAVTVSVTESNQTMGIDCAKLLINCGLSIDNVPMSNRRTLLTQTVYKNLAFLMDYFLEVGADPNARDGHGWTPLNLAVNKNLREMVEILRKHGTNPFIENLNGHSALDIAMNEGNKKLVTMLTSWRKSYYKEKFNKNKDKFLKMLKNVNKDCALYIRKPVKNKSDEKTLKTNKDNKKELVSELLQQVPSSVLEDVRDIKNKHNVPTTKLFQGKDDSNLAICREEHVGLGYGEDTVNELVEPSDDLIELNSENSSSPLLLNESSSSFSSPPSTPSDSSNETEKPKEANKDSLTHNLALIIGTAVVTFMTYHLFRKFRTTK